MPTITIQVGSYVLGSDNGVSVTDISSESHSAPLSLDVFSQARRDGGQLVSAYFKPKTFTIRGNLKAASYEALTTLIETFKQNVTGTNLSLYISDGTTTKLYTVNTSGQVSIPRSRNSLTVVPFEITYLAADPPYGQDATLGGSAVRTNALTATVTTNVYTSSLTMNGSAKPSGKITITFPSIGDLTGIDIVDLTNSRTLNVTRTFAASETLVIDSEARTVKVNNIPVSFTGSFPDFNVGTNQFGINAYTSSGLVLDQQQRLSNGQQPIYLANTYIAQSFTPSLNQELTRIAVVGRKIGNPTHPVSFTISTDSSGVPGTLITNQNIPASSIGSQFNWINVDYSTTATLTAGTTYWISLHVTNDTVDNYYEFRTYYPSRYSGGALYRKDGGSWYAIDNTDLCFKTFYTSMVAGNTTSYALTTSEAFSSTTNKDAGNTTAKWDTSNGVLTMNGASHTQNDSVSTTAYEYVLTGSTFNWGKASPWIASKSGTLTAIKIYLRRDSSSYYGNIVVQLRAHTDGLTLGALLASTSTTLPQSSLTTSSAQYTFDFNTTVSAGTTYDIYVYYQGDTMSQVYLMAGTYTGQTVYGVNEYGNVYATSADMSLNYWTNVNYTTYTDPETAQSLAVDTTNADLVAANVTQVSGAGTANMYGSKTFYVSSDGTNFMQVSTGTVSTFNTTIGTSGKWKVSLAQDASGYVPVIDSLSVDWTVGLSIDASTKRAAQSFQLSATKSVQRIDIMGAKVGSPGSVTVRIETDNAGSPSGTVVTNATATITSSAATTGLNWITAVFSSAATLTGSTTYWIVVVPATGTFNDTNKWLVQANANGVSTGVMKRSTDSGTTYAGFTSAEDMMFRLFSSTTSNFQLSVSVDYIKRYL